MLKVNSDSSPTILSLFKKQAERQSVSRKDGTGKQEPDSGSESDVVITKVVKSRSGTIMSNLNGENESVDVQEDHSITEHTKLLKNNTGNGGKLRRNEVNLSLDIAVRKARTSDKQACMLDNKPTDALKTNMKNYLDDTDTSDAVAVTNESETDFMNKVDINVSRRKIERTSKPVSRTRSWSEEEHDSKTQEGKTQLSRKRKLSLKKSKTDSEVEKKKKTMKNHDDTKRDNKKEKKSREDEQNTNYKMNPSLTADDGRIKHEMVIKEKQLDSEQENKLSKHKIVREHIECKNKEISSSASKFVRVIAQKRKADGNKTNSISTKKTESTNLHENEEPISSSIAETVDKDEKESVNIVTDGECQDDVNGDLEEETVYRVPYYLENFHTIIDSVLNDSEYCRLFNDSDIEYIKLFQNMSGK